jgi:hypothetical protein
VSHSEKVKAAHRPLSCGETLPALIIPMNAGLVAERDVVHFDDGPVAALFVPNRVAEIVLVAQHHADGCVVPRVALSLAIRVAAVVIQGTRSPTGNPGLGWARLSSGLPARRRLQRHRPWVGVVLARTDTDRHRPGDSCGGSGQLRGDFSLATGGDFHIATRSAEVAVGRHVTRAASMDRTPSSGALCKAGQSADPSTQESRHFPNKCPTYAFA